MTAPLTRPQAVRPGSCPQSAGAGVFGQGGDGGDGPFCKASSPRHPPEAPVDSSLPPAR